MLKRVIGEDIRLRCHQGRHAPFVQADIGMIEQVLLNLVVNARDAMPKGGDLLITTKKLHVDVQHIPANEEVKPGNFICLRIRDTGCGIPADILHRIFEPFFTTKEAGKGTGLGLATVYGIVKQHGGWIRVSSSVGTGTVFRIFLPAIDAIAAKPISPEAEYYRWRGSETILLVEDDDSVRHTTRRLLETFGYQVIEAASAGEAMSIWQTAAGKIDLLLTDVVMPGGVTGRDLAKELRIGTSALKVVFVSGYNLNTFSDDTGFLRRENNYFLQKPFKSLLLVETIRRCLDEKRTATA
jgi:CheY-like chemotaxis protein